MRTLVVGANGATGRLLVRQLIEQGSEVHAVVRSVQRMPEQFRDHKQITVVEASVLDLSDAELTELVSHCDAVASCLGHNLTMKGVFGQPRRLVTDATRRLCDAMAAGGEATRPSKFVLMNTAGNRNRDLVEPISLAQKCVIGLLRLLLPPHVDNENAADYLRTRIGHEDPEIQWAVVRPDSLFDQDSVTDYELHPSPIRSAIFNPGRTSRMNVAHFMAALIVNDDLWQTWANQMPVIYNVA